ncbi:amidohydrolase family protein [Streptomyces sp. NPDC095613]|uniref:amidohydrolase family protein n=1 Tax=Streptomyces sp. NPDC095613 TaxID=3155540 RepID=UPI00332E6505
MLKEAGEPGADVKGTLTAGRLADFTVLDTDLTTAGPEARAAARVRSTWVGGECVYRDR